jgi:hypothetical protein
MNVLYLTVDGMMSGTGIRDSVRGGHLEPANLGVSDLLAGRVADWLKRYEIAHMGQYRDKERVAKLDEEGLLICVALRAELPEAKIEYYSDALMRRLPSTGL